MPRYDFMCKDCGFEFEETVPFETRTIECLHCETPTAERLPPLIGGYNGNTGSSSTRPKNSTAMPRSKVFTGNKEIKK